MPENQGQQQQGQQQGQEQGQQQNQQTTWPDDWRQRIAGDDKDAPKMLERFAEPGALWKSYREVTKKIDAGELKANTPFPDKGTAEEQASWRKNHGIPEKPEAYDINLANGLVVGEEDKPMVDSFLKFAHAANVPQDVVKGQLGWYFGTYLPELEKTRGEEDSAFRAETQSLLAKDWGADFKANINAVQSLVGMLPDEVRQAFMRGRMADGKAIGDHPIVLKWLAQVERERNPISTNLPPDVRNDTASIEGELRRLDTLMRTDRKAYNREEGRYRDLLDAFHKKTGKEWAKA